MKPIVGLTMGDAAGIGPEVIAKALAHKEVYDICSPLVVGDASVMKNALKIKQLNPNAKISILYRDIPVAMISDRASFPFARRNIDVPDFSVVIAFHSHISLPCNCRLTFLGFISGLCHPTVLLSG
jgi:4-hydroxy-L-threonine phosphate dehydrogenase PdxA